MVEKNKYYFGFVVLIGLFIFMGSVSAIDPETNVTVDCIECNLSSNYTLDLDSFNLVDRGIKYNLHTNESNVSIMQFYPTPVNYFNGSKYEPINTSIVSTGCEFDYCVRKGIYYADFKQNSLSPNLVKFFYNDSNLSYTPHNLIYINSLGENETISNLVSVNGVVDGSRFIYPGIYGNGFDLKYEYKRSFLKEGLIIQNKSLLFEPNINNSYLSLSFDFNTYEDLYEQNISSGGVTFVKWDKTSKMKTSSMVLSQKKDEEVPAFYLPAPYAFDSNGSFIELNYTFEEINGQTVVSILTPYSWLNDSNRVYPVEIDPSVATDIERQGYIQFDRHNQEFNEIYFNSYGGNNLPVGYNYAEFGSLEVDWFFRSYIEWILDSDVRSTLDSSSAQIEGLSFRWRDQGQEGGDRDTLNLHLVYPEYPDDLTPSSNIDMGDLYDKLNDYSLKNFFNIDRAYGSINNPQEYSSNTVDLGVLPEIEDYIGDILDNNENFVLGLSGLTDVYGASGISKLYLAGVDTSYPPSLEIVYTCDDNSACNTCQNFNNGQSCDCNSECNGNYCGGTSGNYDCSSSCISGGNYAPSSGDCCSGLSWNSGTQECEIPTPVCGNSNVESGEACDDGDSDNYDYCKNDCSYNSCGDGYLEIGVEGCDDGDNSNGDGCTSTCNEESGWSCTGNEPSVCTEVTCPNGIDGLSGECDCDSDSDCDSGERCEFESGGWDACELIQTCSGNIQVITEDSSGSPLDDIKVYLDTTYQGDTSGGEKTLSVSKYCGFDSSIEVRCEDNTFCGQGNVAIDFNNEQDSVTFDCSMCLGEEDLFISQGDVNLEFNSGALSVEVNVHSVNVGETNLKVRFDLIGNDGLVKNTSYDYVNIVSNSQVVAQIDFWNYEDIKYVSIYVDPDNSVEELKTNNFVKRIIADRVDAYFDVDVGYSLINSEIENYLQIYFENVSYANSDVVISVGRESLNFVNDVLGKNIKDHNGVYWGFENNLVTFNKKAQDEPYVGVVGNYEKDNKQVYVAIGNAIDGTIAALRKMTATGNLYLGGNDNAPALVVDHADLSGIRVYDILHNSENLPYYNHQNRNSENFANAIKKVLYENTYDVAIRLVETTNTNPTTLRIKNLNSEFSDNYKDAVLTSNKPVVMSGGIFSNLDAWGSNGEGLAVELAQEGRDVWEIEITGGDIAEDENALDYTYNNLVDDYFPALIGAVQYYTGEITTDYVGHSNGCRVALSSLNNYQENGLEDVGVVTDLITGNSVNVDLQASPSTPVVDTFVGVACPTELNGGTMLSGITRWKPHLFGSTIGDVVMDGVDTNHLTMGDYLQEVYFVEFIGGWTSEGMNILAGIFAGDDKISKNLMTFYNDLSMNENSNFDLSNLNLNKLRLHYGNILFLGHDGVVPVSDMQVILDEVNSNDKAFEKYPGVPFDVDHVFIKNKNKVKENILENLR